MTAAERQRRYRERRRRGVAAARMYVDSATLEALIRAGLLDCREADHPEKVGEAAAEFIRIAIKKNVMPLRGSATSRVTDL
jgi:hypothetical protein